MRGSRPRSLRRLAPRVLLVLLAACTGSRPEEATPPDARAGVANPASTHCLQRGGRLEIRTGPSGGEVGICVFPDGSECEEWALFRGTCQPGSPPESDEPARPAR